MDDASEIAGAPKFVPLHADAADKELLQRLNDEALSPDQRMQMLHNDRHKH